MISFATKNIVIGARAIDPDYERYAALSQLASSTGANEVKQCFAQLKSAAIWDDVLLFFPLRLQHMSGAASSTIYDLRGRAATLVNGPTRNAGGLESTSAAGQYVDFAFEDYAGSSLSGWYFYAGFYYALSSYSSGVDALIGLGLGTTRNVQLAKRSGLTTSFRGTGFGTSLLGPTLSNNDYHSAEGWIDTGVASHWVDRANLTATSFTTASTTTTGVLAVSASSGTGYVRQTCAILIRNMTAARRDALKTILDATIHADISVP